MARVGMDSSSARSPSSFMFCRCSPSRMLKMALSGSAICSVCRSAGRCLRDCLIFELSLTMTMVRKLIANITGDRSATMKTKRTVTVPRKMAWFWKAGGSLCRAFPRQTEMSLASSKAETIAKSP